MIDKIATRESLTRFEARQRNADAFATAAKALLWFAEYGNDDKKPEDVVTVSAKIVASSTPNAEIAQRYIEQAVKGFADQIIEAAISSAKATYEVGRQQEQVYRLGERAERSVGP